jgi:hypothetical protein
MTNKRPENILNGKGVGRERERNRKTEIGRCSLTSRNAPMSISVPEA